MKAKRTCKVVWGISAGFLIFVAVLFILAPGNGPGRAYANENESEDSHTQTMEVTAYVAAEETAPPKPPSEEDGRGKSQAETGDMQQVKGWVLLLGAGGIVVAGIVVGRRKRVK